MAQDETLPRRYFLKVLGAAGGALAGAGASACAAPLQQLAPAAAKPAVEAPSRAVDTAHAAGHLDNTIQPALILNATELAFVEAAVDTLIPADDLTPSASECGVAVFIDRQLAGAFGAGARLYRSGPFLRGKPEHGYQLSLTPLELFKAAIAEINTWLQQPFDALSEAKRAETLTQLEKAVAPVRLGQTFFELLLALTMEGFFADPMYGGNRGKAGWKMLGYPGLPATYERDIAEYHGKRYERDPQSISDFS